MQLSGTPLTRNSIEPGIRAACSIARFFAKRVLSRLVLGSPSRSIQGAIGDGFGDVRGLDSFGAF